MRCPRAMNVWMHRHRSELTIISIKASMTRTDVIVIEWGEWECPVCNSVQEDPEYITVTVCTNGHVCLLGPVEGGVVSIGVCKSARWAEELKKWSFK